MFVFFLLAHVCVRLHLDPRRLGVLVEANHHLVLLAGWSKISPDVGERVVAFSSGRSFFSENAFPLARRGGSGAVKRPHQDQAITVKCATRRSVPDEERCLRACAKQRV